MSASYTVGRAPACDVVVDDEYASPRHARFTQDDDGAVWVEDLGATNVVRVNGVPAYSRTRIYPGDVVTIGRTHLPWRAP